MSRSEPKFSVGQFVMIRSLSRPDLNTDKTMVTSREYIYGSGSKTSAPYWSWSYKTTDQNKSPYLFWDESALHPRPKPASQTFSELMEECNSGELQLIGESE